MNNVVGPYGMAGWPASDVWPGPELDMVEIDYNGVPYATVHWKGDDGSNQMQSITMNGVDPTQVHTYAMDWQADHISFFVDGTLMGTFTDHIPADYAHGGENEMLGVGMQTWWNNGALDGNNWVTIYDASYTATSDGGSAVPVTPTPVTPDPVPVAPLVLSAGTGADALVLKVSQDAYQGSAQYTVSVDGQQVGGTFTASASHAAGQSDTLTLKGDWAAGGHQVAVHFLNDAWDGTAATDRNLYVDSASFNGQAVAGAAQALLTDTAPGGFAFTEAAGPVTAGPTIPPPISAGTGADALVLKVSQDAYQGSAQYTVSVDGQQVGGTFTASASHAAGQSDTLTLKGDWAAGDHQVAVHFLNDAWDGTAATDRNLYVDSASFNGQAVAGAAQALLTDTTPGGFAFTEAGATAPVPVVAGTAGPDLFDATPAGGSFAGGAGRDLFVFDAGDGHSTVADFASGTDKLVLIGFTAADVAEAQATENGHAGLLVTFGDGAAHGGSVFLEGVAALADKDAIFT